MAATGINSVHIIGNLTKDPVLPYKEDTQNAAWQADTEDKKPLRISVAVNRPPTKDGKPQQADFVDCVLFGPAARSAALWLKKGRLVAIQGSLRFSKWEENLNAGRPGEAALNRTRTKLEVRVGQFMMLDKKPEADVPPSEVYDDVE